MDKLYIIIPAYNESENLDSLINEWYPIIEKYNGNGESRLVVINDGSKDDTYERLCDYARTRHLLCPVTKPNSGHGATLLYGYRMALNEEADYIFQTDSDGQTLADEFHQFWELRNEYDSVIGHRSNRQDGASRKFVEDTLRFILLLVFGVKIPDSNAPFRLMKRSILEKYISRMPQDFNLPNVMLTTYFSYFREKIKFVEITFKPRQAGTNSINIKKIVMIGWKALGDFISLRKNIKAN